MGGAWPEVVILGGGFAGLAAARVLERARVPYLLLDARNHHLFQPLLYQVATGFLEGPAVAYPLRALLRRGRFLLGRVERVDLEGKRLFLEGGDALPYRFLVVATGSLPSDLGVPGVREHALFLKTLGQALRVRYRLLEALEKAARRGRPLDLLVVGGGPTGVELAGALSEFLRYALPRDFPEVPAGAVTLLEAGPRLLPAFRPALGRYAEGALAQLGVRVRLGAQVAEVGEGWVRLSGGERLKGDLVLWAVGVRGNPLPGLPADARGRVPTDPCLRLVGYPEVYVVGDLNGLGFPQLAPVALQQGRWAARNLLRALREQDPLPFRYRDRGQLAVIGRNRAVAELWGLGVAGLPAWLLWAFVHLRELVGFRNRLLVFLDWAYTYLFREPGVRILPD
ncbi:MULTISPECIES: NAD(P)/FAD-dependent oxidoreductase [Thermus]|uniref:NADH dehydrogenase n=1 Tax=Thermus scotoductus (strain ATCC 700910 / SA-01) TaxID=743525 RepID=E8PLW7_THESS|nr:MULTISPECIES: NAD(P)/FAD-dependent oxidoreductase [Thermus]ADW22386.1 NADH dehydrogenase [Thermus scotoductus SA-01]ETN88601.1 NADH dehydrogenase [Thermus sp. NMX2.A1]